VRPAEQLDCRGLLCPLPVLRTRSVLARLAPGQILEVVATDPASPLDMAVFSHRSGHELVRQERRGDEFVFFLRKASAAEPA
jgi:TusA-related sulfurtransferase